MTWPLDYLGAHESCVLGEYTLRYQQYARSGVTGPAASPYGWHNCATVINPDPSDTTSSLEQRCEAVLPADVDLETRPDFLVTYYDDGNQDVEVVPSRSGVSCAEWAQSLAMSEYCPMLSELATQWMQHYYDARRGAASTFCADKTTTRTVRINGPHPQKDHTASAAAGRAGGSGRLVVTACDGIGPEPPVP